MTWRGYAEALSPTSGNPREYISEEGFLTLRMPRSRVAILSSLALVLVTMSLASGIPSSNASAAYQPGVHVGDWWKYGSLQCNPFCPPQLPAFLDINSINSTVTDVIGNNVTIENGVKFNNGTVTTITLSGNVETGQGNLTYQTFYYLIAGGLAQGAGLYDSPLAPTVNITLAENILGAIRPVDHLYVSKLFYTLEQEWDQATGILLAVRLFSVGISASIYLTDVRWLHTPDFIVQVSAYRGSLAIELGETVNTTVKVQSMNGFKGTVNLTASVQPEGPLLRLETSTVEISDVPFRCGDLICYGSGWAYSTLSVSAPKHISVGTYIATIEAANQTVSHSVKLTIAVTSPATSPTTPPTTSPPGSGTSQGQNTFSIFGLAPLLFYGLSGGALALLASILILIFLTRKPRGPSQDDSQSLT